jgi:2-polyprenyl-6-methoxyphenol hydroxylase-like FAD-dependent oxidoreductase
VYRIPFQLTQADAGVDVILLTPYTRIVDFCLQTPNGLIIEPWRTMAEPGMRYVLSNGVSYYRLVLPTQLRPDRFVFDRLVGITTLFGTVDTSREGYILVETTPDGWWYSAPVPRDYMMAMLMTDSDLCGRTKLSALTRWRELLARAPTTFARVAGTMLWGPRVFSALSQRLCRRELASPWIAVGDAALAVDPISGSGVVRALRSAHAGANTALALLNSHTSQPIAAYEADRDRECTTYLHERALYYGVEQRWQTSPFWQRRSAVLPQVASNNF